MYNNNINNNNIEEVKMDNRFNSYTDYEDVNVDDFKEMTKVQKLEYLEDFISCTMADSDLMESVCNFIKEQKDAVIKKNEYNKSKRAEKTSVVEDERALILELMSKKDTSTLWSIPQLINELGDEYIGKSNQWMSSRLTPLVKSGLLEKCKSNIKGDRKSYYKINKKAVAVVD